jgi:hypothetical protein
MHQDAKKIKARVRTAFKNLLKDNIIAMANFTCCNGCGGAEMERIIEKDGFDGFAFYHNQDNDIINETATTYITFGDDAKIAKKIIKALEKSQLIVEWSGKMQDRIFVKGLK